MDRGWVWEVADGVGFWRVALLEQWQWPVAIRAVFSSRTGGVSEGPFSSLNLSTGVGDDPRAVAQNRRRLAAAAGFDPAACARVQQVHGRQVCTVPGPGAWGEADALITSVPGTVLCVRTADCVPIYVIDPRARVAGLAHAGWRGTAADVVGALVATMATAFGCRPADLLGAVGPAIGPCCYEVDAPVITALEKAATWSGGVLKTTGPDHARLDLWDANRRRLLDAGLAPDRVAVAGICTACHPDLLFSHRRDGGRTGRMEAALWLP